MIIKWANCSISNRAAAAGGRDGPAGMPHKCLTDGHFFRSAGLGTDPANRERGRAGGAMPAGQGKETR